MASMVLAAWQRHLACVADSKGWIARFGIFLILAYSDVKAHNRTVSFATLRLNRANQCSQGSKDPQEGQLRTAHACLNQFQPGNEQHHRQQPLQRLVGKVLTAQAGTEKSGSDYKY
jgi:hypothetical protein